MNELNRLTGTFRDWADEVRFRQSIQSDIQWETRSTLIVAAALVAMFAISDYNYIGLSPTFYHLIAVRSVMILCCLFLAFHLNDRPLLTTHPWVYSIGPMAIAIGSIMILYLRPQSLPTMLTATTMTIVGFYLFVPNLIRGMISTSLFFSAGFLVTAWIWAGAEPTRIMTMGLLLVMANMIGYVAALRLAYLQRRQFLLLSEERHSRQLLSDEVEQREVLERRLRMMAQTDGLTGISNRWHFMETARSVLRTANPRKRPICIWMIDVDHFKAINDEWGHAVGDKVLKAIADQCRKSLLDDDLLGRFGGEEFVALLRDADARTGYRMAEKLRREIAALPFDGYDTLQATVTIGVAEFNHAEEDLDDLDLAISRADAALYEGKRRGRNRVFFAPPASENLAG